MSGNRILVSVFAFGLVLRVDAPAQITSKNSDRHFVAGARAASFADAYVAEAHDITSMYTNPAALTWLSKASIMLNYSLEQILATDNIMNENVALPISLRRDVGLGIGATLSHVGHIRDTSPISGFGYRQYGVEMGIGWTVTRFLSVGAGVNARYGKTRAANLGAVHFTLAGFYSPSPEISYGISFQGLGQGLDYSFDSLASITVITQKNLDKSVQIGVSWRFRDNEDEPILTMAVANQKIFGIKGVVYKGGIEYVPFSLIALRVGYWVGDETLAPKFGVGIHLSPVQIDYAISPSELEPVFHQIAYEIRGK